MLLFGPGREEDGRGASVLVTIGGDPAEVVAMLGGRCSLVVNSEKARKSASGCSEFPWTPRKNFEAAVAIGPVTDSSLHLCCAISAMQYMLRNVCGAIYVIQVTLPNLKF
eukprot:9447001-Pyramimonas_sp.AAC.1